MKMKLIMIMKDDDDNESQTINQSSDNEDKMRINPISESTKLQQS